MSATDPRALALLSDLAESEEGRQRQAKAIQGLAQDAARGRSLFDSVHDAARGQAARSRELKTSARLLRDPLERARLTALNAGLEGARKGDPVGKALVAMAEELRVLLTRGLDALDEHAAAIGDVDREREQWLEQLSAARDLSALLFERTQELQALDAGAASSVERLGNGVRQLLGVDPERSRLLVLAAGQARALEGSLRALSAGGAEPELEAVLEPLTRHLAREDRGDG